MLVWILGHTKLHEFSLKILEYSWTAWKILLPLKNSSKELIFDVTCQQNRLDHNCCRQARGGLTQLLSWRHKWHLESSIIPRAREIIRNPFRRYKSKRMTENRSRVTHTHARFAAERGGEALSLSLAASHRQGSHITTCVFFPSERRAQPRVSETDGWMDGFSPLLW